MIIRKLGLIFAITMLAVLFMAGCKGATGPAGPAGNSVQSPPHITSILAIPDSVAVGQTSQLIVAAYDPNGDSVTYLWTATAGTFDDITKSAPVWTAPDSTVLAFIRVRVTAHNDTTSGSVVVGVNTSVPTVFPSYLGNDATNCGHCHSATVAGWMTTVHFSTWDSLAPDTTNLYCVQCHTTGFDDQYNAAGQRVQRGVNSGGYDDNHSPGLKGVQCEMCHGPMGPNQAQHVPQLNAALDGSQCGKCHVAYPDYITSGHGTVIARIGGLTEWASASCQGCHISEGFLIAKDPDWANRTLDPSNLHQIACATCHDPHLASPGNDSQLRVLTDVVLPFNPVDSLTYTVSGWGKGQLCAQCHHSRRTYAQIIAQFPSGNAHPGPHDGPQSDMLAGHGCWEVPGDTVVVRTSQHAGVEDMCITCHFEDRPDQGRYVQDPVHTFLPHLDQCRTCHPSANDFNINGVQTEIRQLLDSLGMLLPPVGSPEVMDSTNNPQWTPTLRQAGWAWYFVKNDRSLGVHNHMYARTLLLNAIAYIHAHPAETPEAKAEESFWR